MAKVHELTGRIYLVGMTGSGKTTVGKKLAKQLDVEFVDLDDAIEERTHKTVNELFGEYGEFDFRACEAHVLRDLPRRYPIAVIATGGGTPLHFDSMHFLNETGLTIFLDVDEKHIIERLADERAERPMLANDDWEQVLTTLIKERTPTYKEAQVHVDVNDGSSDTAVENILKQLPQVTGH